jgi:hypothetical protein
MRNKEVHLLVIRILVLIHLFTYLFNDIISTSGSTALYGGLIVKNKLQKDVESNNRGLI